MLEKKPQHHLWDDFLVAVSFLTVIPHKVDMQVRQDALARATLFFPLIGLGIAAASLVAVKLVGPFLSERIAVLMLVLFPMLLSGCLHVDGFADCCDALFQKKDRQEILRVMKDPHIGVWGTVSVVFCILLKWECLMALPLREQTFLVALTLSRWAHVFLSYLQPYAGGPGGLGALIAQKIGTRELTGAAIFALIVAWILAAWYGIAVFLGTSLFVWLLGHYYRKKLGGITGDLIGATGEMSEIAVYILMLCLTHLCPIPKH